MAFVELIDDSEIFERDRAAFGYVPNFTRLFAHRPAVYEAWLQLKDTISGSMDLRRYDLRRLEEPGREQLAVLATSSWLRPRAASSARPSMPSASRPIPCSPSSSPSCATP